MSGPRQQNRIRTLARRLKDDPWSGCGSVAGGYFLDFHEPEPHTAYVVYIQ